MQDIAFYATPLDGRFGSPAFAFIALSVIGVVVVASIALFQRSRLQHRRLQLIQETLRNPGLSPEVHREALAVLGSPGRQTTRAFFGLGWFGAFAGVTWLCTEPRGDEFAVAVGVTVMAFALLTYPFALRELEARRA